MSDALQMFQTMSMLLSDRPDKRVDAVFFHARSFGGDDDGLFDLARHAGEMANLIVINGGDGRGVDGPHVRAWPGADHYMVRLTHYHHSAPVVRSRPAVHTHDEAIAFNELAEDRGWKRAIVIGQPFHLLRIMLSHLDVMAKRDYQMQIYAAAPTSVDWQKVTNGNQGQPGLQRFQQIEMEMERIVRYQSQRNLVEIGELIHYLLVGRDRITI